MGATNDQRFVPYPYPLFAGIVSQFWRLLHRAVPVGWWMDRERRPRRAKFWVWVHSNFWLWEERAAGRL